MPPAPWISGSTRIAGDSLRHRSFQDTRSKAAIDGAVDVADRASPGARSSPANSAVHPLAGVAYRHRAQACRRDSRRGTQGSPCRVTVAAVQPELQRPSSWQPQRQPIRNRRRTRGSVRPAAGLGQPRRQALRAGSCAKPPNMTWGIRLKLGERTDSANMRVVVAVARGPPGGYAVDQRSAVLQDYTATFRAERAQRRGGALHLGVGAPEVQQEARPSFCKKEAENFCSPAASERGQAMQPCVSAEPARAVAQAQ